MQIVQLKLQNENKMISMIDNRETIGPQMANVSSK